MVTGVAYDNDRAELDLIRSLIDLAAVIGADTPLIRRGTRYKGLCIFHDDTDPSLWVYDDGHFHCYGCGAHGDIFAYLMRRDGLSFPDAKAKAAEIAGIQLHKPFRIGREHIRAIQRHQRTRKFERELEIWTSLVFSRWCRELTDLQDAIDWYTTVLGWEANGLTERSSGLLTDVQAAAAQLGPAYSRTTLLEYYLDVLCYETIEQRLDLWFAVRGLG